MRTWFAFSENLLLHEYRLLNKSTAKTTTQSEMQKYNFCPSIYAKMPLPQKKMAKYCKYNSFKEKSCFDELVQLLTWMPKSQYISDSDLNCFKVLNSISIKIIRYKWLVLSQHHLAVDCHKVFTVTHSSVIFPLKYSLILWIYSSV